MGSLAGNPSASGAWITLAGNESTSCMRVYPSEGLRVCQRQENKEKDLCVCDGAKHRLKILKMDLASPEQLWFAA